MSDWREESAKRDAALKEAIRAWLALVGRVNQAGEDGYDVLNPDVLAEAMWEVAQAQIAAGRREVLDQYELFTREYERHMTAIDHRFPRRSPSSTP